MFNKLLQAVAITAAVYVTMLISQPQQSGPFIEIHYPSVRVTQLEYFLAEVINRLREPVQRRA
jgi:hypothetical protein